MKEFRELLKKKKEEWKQGKKAQKLNLNIIEDDSPVKQDVVEDKDVQMKENEETSKMAADTKVEEKEESVTSQ